MPVMTKLGFGNGEISTDIKAIAPILDAELLLTYFVLLLLCFFATATVLMGLLDAGTAAFDSGPPKGRTG
ncbi:MAG: hypothetical protein ACLUJG_07725 [Lawsonibacter sp.]